MTINGLGQFDMMSAYNRINNIPKAPTAEQTALAAGDVAKKPVEETASVESKPEEQQSSGLKINLNLDGIRAKSNASLDDISRDFTRRDNFSITGVGVAPTDAEMANNMEKAISDMNKDSSLRQYQFFVGEGNTIVNDEDGIVIMK